MAPVQLEGKIRDCDCIRVGAVNIEESTDSEMPGLVDPSVSDDTSTEEMEGEGTPW